MDVKVKKKKFLQRVEKIFEIEKKIGCDFCFGFDLTILCQCLTKKNLMSFIFVYQTNCLQRLIATTYVTSIAPAQYCIQLIWLNISKGWITLNAKRPNMDIRHINTTNFSMAKHSTRKLFFYTFHQFLHLHLFCKS